jgi:hypothetical protein
MKNRSIAANDFRLVLMLLVFSIPILGAPAGTRLETDLSGTGWFVWLDKTAAYQSDVIYPANFNLATLPVNAPTVGWGQLFSNPIPWQNVGTNSSAVLQVSVPGTVEEYFWNANNGDYRGVSWWGRDFTATGTAGKKVKIWIENTRLRSEVYVNQRLVGYDCVGNLPFESDITSALVAGTNKLALRITDPDGNFSWGDYDPPISWGNQKILVSHGFGGVMGKVKLIVEEPVAVKDLYVKNKPAITEVDVTATVANEGTTAWSGSMAMDVMTTDPTPVSVYTTTITGLSVNAGASTMVTRTISVPSAKVWDVGKGNLYNLKAVLSNGSGVAGDGLQQRFGFRWFDIVNHTTGNAMYRLNGKRIFLKTAISWGFFPANGMYATPAMVTAQIDAAQSLGLNMLNFHRCIGQTIVLDAADERGLLYYEEPGAYSSYYCHLFNSGYNNQTLPRTDWNNFGIGRQMGREKVLRMVMRDRSHPSLIQFNMVNEPGGGLINETKQDMRDAHALDPSRFLTYGSGFQNEGDNGDNKCHMLPNDTAQYYYGFCDIHNLNGMAMGSYFDSSYINPTNYQRYTTDTREIRFWGEENAIASLPRFQKMYNYYSNAANPRGWDGNAYVDRYNGLNNYITSKNLTAYYPSMDTLTMSTGNVSFYAHGRGLENALMSDVSDGYAINGWECEKNDNFSGIVDQLRNLKGEAKYYNDYSRPLYIAVKAREKIGHTGDAIIVDLFIVNQNVLAGGPYTLTLQSLKPDRTTQQIYSGTVTVTGGDRFGELLAQNITVNLNGGKGYYKLKASLSSGATQVADGHDEIIAVDWRSMVLSTNGAIASTNTALTTFLNTTKGLNLPTFTNSLGTLKYIVAGQPGGAFSTDSLLRRVNTDGTTLVIVEYADQWMGIIRTKGIIANYAIMTHGGAWVGGGFFLRAHPTFNGLPVNRAMNWEYQVFVRYDDHTSYGFQLTGEEPVVSDWNSGDARICTAVGIIPYGKGKILFSTIPITPSLSKNIAISNVPKKVLCNYLAWGADPANTTYEPVIDPPDPTSGALINASSNGSKTAGISVMQIVKGARIRYSIPFENATVTFKIYNAAGRMLWNCSRVHSDKGLYFVTWEPGRVVAGTYFLQTTVVDKNNHSSHANIHKILMLSR